MSLKSGHKIVPLTEEENKSIESFHGHHREGCVRFEPDGWFFTKPYIQYADRLYDFKFKANDILIMTYPKCGTTWTQEIIWTMVHNSTFDIAKAAIPVIIRSPFIEGDFLFDPLREAANLTEGIFDSLLEQTYPGKDPKDGVLLQFGQLADEPRVLKTHLPFSLLTPKLIDTCKVIYVVRHPKDVAVSYQHHNRLLECHGYRGTAEDFVDHFINNRLLYGPFWPHLKEAWNLRKHPNLHFCYYEDMKKDPKAEILSFQKFVGTKLTDKNIDEIVEHTSFKAMKERGEKNTGLTEENPSPVPNLMVNTEVEKTSGGFFRKGEAGDWKNKLTMDQAQKIDDWTAANCKSFGPEFQYATAF